MAEATAYTFQALPSDRHIRLLRVSYRLCNLGEAHGKAISDIETFAFDEAPGYNALSYTWGQAKPEKTISLQSGQLLYLTENLRTALPYVLKRCKAEYIWIDQLCINADDSDERSAQVALMGDIFSRAETVLIWLGERIRRQGLLSWLLEEVGDESRTSPFQRSRHGDEVYYDSALRKQLQLGITDKTTSSIVTETLSEVFQRPWFRRTWVLQEAVLAVQAIFIVEELAMSPLGLYELIEVACIGSIRNLIERLSEGAQGCRHFVYMLDIRTENGVFRQSFQDILTSHRRGIVQGSFRATDRRDFVYAILGIRERQKTPVLTANYSISPAQVFAQAARVFVHSASSLDILKLCEGIGYTSDRSSGIEKLPSWVPDWSTSYSGLEAFIPGERVEFCADKGSHQASIKASSWNELWVRGKIIARIDRLSLNCLNSVRDYCTMVFAKTMLYCSPLVESLLGPTSDPQVQSTLPTSSCSGFSVEGLLERTLSVMLCCALRRGKSDSESSLVVIARLLQLYEEDRQRAADDDILNDPRTFRPSMPPIPVKTRIAELVHRWRNMTCYHRSILSECEEKSCETERFKLLNGIIPLHEMEKDAEIFVTDDGLIGLAHRFVKGQDVVCILHGFDLPVILRPTPDGQYEYVTPCYLENAMRGEAMTWSEEEADDIVLV